MVTKVVVRRAKVTDAVNVFKLLQRGWNSQVVEYCQYDDMKGMLWILSIIEEGFLAVADMSGRIVGAAGVSPFMPRWSRQWMLDMEFLYIDPNCRANGVAKELLKAVNGFADKVKLSTTFGIQTGEEVDKKDRFMQMSGWVYTGGNFLRPASGQIQDQTVDTV